MGISRERKAMAKTVIPAKLWKTMEGKYVTDALENYTAVLQNQSSLPLVADGIWCALEEAHNTWRTRPGFAELIGSEEYANSLNAAARLELAGPVVYNIWAKKAQDCLEELGLPLNETVMTTGFEKQMIEMEELDFDQPPLMNNIFVINRRRFVDGTRISGKGALFEYMMERHPTTDINFLFRLTRQIILANGGGAPIEW